MAFNLFSQPQGPTVSISLFGDAARAGAQLAQAIPNPVTAGIQGALEGYQQGQQINARNQEAAIRQNEIEQLPIRNQMQEQQLEGMQLNNQAKELQNEQEATNQDLTISAQQAGLNNQISQNRAAQDFADKQSDLVRSFPSMSGPEKENALFSGQYADVFSKNPKLQQDLIVGAMPEMSPAGQLQGQYQLEGNRIRYKYQAMGLQAQRKYGEASAALLGDDTTGVTNDIRSKTGLDPNFVMKNSNLVDRNSYELDSNGNLKVDPTTGELIKKSGPSENLDNKLPHYDLLYKDPRTGQYQIFQNDSLDKDFRKKFEVWKKAGADVDGSSMQSELNLLSQNYNLKKQQLQNPQPQPQQQQQAPQQAPTQSQGQLTQVGWDLKDYENYLNAPEQPQEKPLYYKVAQNYLKLGDKTMSAIEPNIKDLFDKTIQAHGDPQLRASANFQVQRNQLINQTVRGITDTQFNNSKALQAQFTQKDVDAENAQIRDQARSKYLVAGAYGDLIVPDDSYIEAAIKPYLVSSPSDLYYKRQSPTYFNQIDSLTQQYADIETQRQKATAARSQTAAKWQQALSG